MPFNPLVRCLAATAAILPLAAGIPQAVTYADGVEVPATPPVVTATSNTHGPYTGRPMTTGPLTASGGILGTAISSRSASPAATTYPSDGDLHEPQPAPYVPAGGLGTNGTMPVYRVQSDYDYQSVALALYMEWLHYDLFTVGLSRWSEQDYVAVGLGPEIRDLFQWMAEQSVGHITLLTNILGPDAPKQCTFNYPFHTLREWIDFCQKTTRITESTLYGFIPHLDSRPVASLMLGSVAISARQQLIFRQIEGLFPMPIWFQSAIPQSWGWSLIAPFFSSCPAGQRLVWQNFPPLVILNPIDPYRTGGGAGAGTNITGLGGGLGSSNLTGVPPSQLCPNATGMAGGNVTSGGGSVCAPGITSSRPALSRPGRQISLRWSAPTGEPPVGPGNSYVPTGSTRTPTHVAWLTQLNVTYTPLTGVTPAGGAGGGNATGGGNSTGGAMTGMTTQPDLATYQGDPAVNGTVFIAVTDSNPYLTPFNVYLINPHVVAGPAVYQAG